MRIFSFFLSCFFCLTAKVYSQNFTELFRQTAPELRRVNTASADLNNDGQFEFLVAGQISGGVVHYIIHFDGTNAVVVDNPFPMGPYGDFLLEDFNKDGLIDVLITKDSDSSPNSKIYFNQGGFIFKIGQEFNGEDSPIRFAKLVDFDNDGQKEILNWGGEIYKNRSLVLADFVLDQTLNSRINKFEFTNFSHIDANKDGFQDVVYFQSRTNGDHELFLNDQKGGFNRESFSNNNSNINNSVPVDIDGDGVQELAVLEIKDNIPAVHFYSYVNNELVASAARDVVLDNPSSGLIFNDIDQDGDIDMIQMGFFNGTKSILRLYRNQDNLEFLVPEDFDFSISNGAFGDLDNDGDLDLFSFGNTPTASLMVFQNDFNQSNELNTGPAVPNGLSQSIEDSGIKLSWDSSSDLESSSASLTYNVFIRNNQNDDYFLRPLVNGKELSVLGIGNVGFFVQKIFNCLPNGEYDWGVQTVDPTSNTSEFALGESFLIDRAEPVAPGNLQVARVTEGLVDLSWSDESDNESAYLVFRRRIETPDFPNTYLASLPKNSISYLDQSVEPETSYEYKVVALSCRLTSPSSLVSATTRIQDFTLERAYQISDLGSGISVKGADVDSDGLMDLILTDDDEQVLLSNKGNLEFEVKSDFIDQGTSGGIQVLDLDHDNLMDLFLEKASANASQFKRNDGDKTFSSFFYDNFGERLTGNIELTDFYSDKTFEAVEFTYNLQRIEILQILSLDTAAYWPKKTILLNRSNSAINGHQIIDYDLDGKQDILLFRRDGIEVLTNQGDLNFKVDFYAAPESFQVKLVKDLTGDGLLDFLVNYNGTGTGEPMRIFSILDNSIQVTQTDIAFSNSNVQYIDIDNDGLPDVITGDINVYRNTGGGSFELSSSIQSPILGFFNKIESWDFDLDGDVDIVLLGEHLRGEEEFYIYRNNTIENNQGGINKKPLSPSSISLEVDNDINIVKVSWEAGSDQETPEGRLKYSISIEDNEGNTFYSSHATAEGELLKANGGMTVLLNKTFRCIPNGDFVVYVQTIDEGGRASSRGVGQAFTVTGTAPLPVTNLESKTLSHRLIELTWIDNSDREKEYRIYRKKLSNDNYSPFPFAVLDANSESFIDSLIAPNSEVEYRVVAFNCAFPEESVTVTGKTFPRLFSEIQTIDINIRGFNFLGKGDVDADGDEDFLVRTETNNDNSYALLINNSGVFELSSLDFPEGSRRAGAAVLVDYDLDNDLDIYLLSSQQSSLAPISNMYLNDGKGSFTESTINFNFPVNLGITDSPPIWMDYDRDGDLDLFFSVDVVDNERSFVIYEQRNDLFIQKDHQIEGVIKSNNPFADYDNDGEPDLLILGNDNRLSLFSISSNNSFIEEEVSGFGIYAAFDPASKGTMEWFDFNSDGLLDILMSGPAFGMNDSEAKLSILINTGDNGFERLVDPIKNSTPFTLGDFDNDGDVDIITARHDVLVLENLDGEVIRDFLPKVNFARVGEYSDLILSDIDNDGDLDLLIAHTGINNEYLKVYENVVATSWMRPNMPPTIPENLRIDDLNAAIRFSWDLSIDDLTKIPALTYEVSMKNQLSGELIYSSLLDNQGRSVGTNLSSISSTNNFLFRTGGIDEMSVVFSVRSVDQNGLKSGYSEPFLFNTITSVKKDLLKSDLKVFPNPVENVLHFTFETANQIAERLEIVSLQGKVVFEEIGLSRDLKKGIDISDLSSGVYLVKLYFEGSIDVIRILKK